MGRLSGFLSSLGNRWALGAVVAVALGCSLALFGGAAFAIVGLAAYLFGLDAAGEWTWFLVSAAIWVPLGLGVPAPALVEVLGPRVKDRREAERRRDLARFTPSPR